MFTAVAKRKESAFTLIELLIVIGIIAIITAIAVPVFLNQRKKANDATLRADTKSVGQTIQGWFLEEEGRDVGTLASITGKTGGQIALGIYGEGKTISDPTVNWNHYPALPPLSASPNNQVTVSVNTGTVANFVRHAPGDFCLSSDNPKSNFNYSSPGATGHGNYDKLVYYDTKLGGLTTMTDMVTARQSGNITACAHFAERYMNAHGIPLS